MMSSFRWSYFYCNRSPQDGIAPLPLLDVSGRISIRTDACRRSRCALSPTKMSGSAIRHSILYRRDVYFLRLSHQPGCRDAQGVARHHLHGRHPLRSRPQVLVLWPVAMVLGARETRLLGVDRRPLHNQKTPWPRPDETNQRTVCPLEKKLATARFRDARFADRYNQSVRARAPSCCAATSTRTHNFCKELVEHGKHLWTFLRR
jgi:hypothetical protein